MNDITPPPPPRPSLGPRDKLRANRRAFTRRVLAEESPGTSTTLTRQSRTQKKDRHVLDSCAYSSTHPPPPHKTAREGPGSRRRFVAIPPKSRSWNWPRTGPAPRIRAHRSARFTGPHQGRHPMRLAPLQARDTLPGNSSKARA